MMKAQKRDCANCDYRGRSIYIVGPQRFKNEVILKYLEINTAARLHTAQSLAEISSEFEPVPLQHKLILIDCSGFGREQIRALFADASWVRLHAHMRFLFQVNRGLGMEEEMLQNGVQGIVYEDDSTDLLLEGICAVNRGEIWASRKAVANCLCHLAQKHQQVHKVEHGLTDREKQLLALLTECKSNEEIAEALFISPHTVKTHLYNIFKKINVPNRLQAILWAAKNL